MHPHCIAELISTSGKCSCGLGLSFGPISADSLKRHRADLSLDSSEIHNETVIPDSEPLSKFTASLTAQSTIADFSKCMAQFYDARQRREEALEARNMQTVRETSDEIHKLKAVVHVHDANLALFELTVGGIHGDSIPEVRTNFIEICAFLKVPLDSSDIVNLRFMKRDTSNKAVKAHNIAVRLHSSKHVSQILSARKQFKPLKHVTIFPRLTATSRILHLHPMLPAEKYKLLRLASEAKSKLNYKFCWSTDTGLIFLKKDETSLPILIRDESSLAAINDRAVD